MELMLRTEGAPPPRARGGGRWRSRDEDEDGREEEAKGDDDEPRLRSSMVRAAADDGVARRHTWAPQRSIAPTRTVRYSIYAINSIADGRYPGRLLHRRSTDRASFDSCRTFDNLSHDHARRDQLKLRGRRLVAPPLYAVEPSAPLPSPHFKIDAWHGVKRASNSADICHSWRPTSRPRSRGGTGSW